MGEKIGVKRKPVPAVDPRRSVARWWSWIWATPCEWGVFKMEALYMWGTEFCT